MRVYVALWKEYGCNEVSYVGPSLQEAVLSGSWMEVWENGKMVEPWDWSEEEHNVWVHKNREL